MAAQAPATDASYQLLPGATRVSSPARNLVLPPGSTDVRVGRRRSPHPGSTSRGSRSSFPKLLLARTTSACSGSAPGGVVCAPETLSRSAQLASPVRAGILFLPASWRSSVTGRSIDLLAASSLFGGMDRTALEALNAQALERTYRRNQYVFREGDPGQWLFVVAEGLIKIELDSSAGDEVVLTTIARPGTFGELALLDGGPRSASAEAVEDSRLLAISRGVILDMLASAPPIADALLRALGSQLRHLTERTADATFLDMSARVAKLLLALARVPGTGEVDRPHAIQPMLTQTELAQMVGGSRQSVNRILAAFESRGLVQVHGRQIVLLDPVRLRERARG
jgi:CRP/FNR family transcriptional regulator, cyclic AMP receptor protein